METIECQGTVDKGASRIRGYHNTYPCKHKAKYKITYRDGRVEYLCGIHKQALVKMGYNVTIEPLK